MYTEQELKERCTPEFIKWCCELAEGDFMYECSVGEAVEHDDFPLLIRRAVDGWNKSKPDVIDNILTNKYLVTILTDGNKKQPQYWFKNYIRRSLIISECAMLHCLFDIFKE